MAVTYAIGFVVGVVLWALILHRFGRFLQRLHPVSRWAVSVLAGVVMFALVHYTQVIPRLAMRVHVFLNLDHKHGTS